MVSGRFGKIGVILGGPSSERSISLKSGRTVSSALKAAGHSVVEIDLAGHIYEDVLRLKAQEIDVAFIALHGRYGEDGTVQTMLEELKIPYTGSGPRSRSFKGRA